MRTDYLLYIFHDIFWISFLGTRFFMRLRGKSSPQRTEPESVVTQDKSVRFSRVLVVLHTAAFFSIYFGLARALFVHRVVPLWFSGQRIIGAATILAATLLTCSALVCFRSWRIRAKLDKGHQLTTAGPFRFIRHPIYTGFNLLALGSAIWVPTPLMWLAAIAMAIAGDLRARAEERLLVDAFPFAYRDYCRVTKRFLPGVY